MNGIDLLIILLLAAVLGGAGYAVYRSKKSGNKCIGCPESGSCNGKCQGCGNCNCKK